jgi:hypothetical protein
MCDYSLHGVASRPAKVGDKLITADFSNTLTRGFSAAGQPDVAVCFLPGTEIVFDQEVQRHYAVLQTLFFKKSKWNTGQKLGRFRQINMDRPNTHHDAIEFSDGRVVLLTDLRAGQKATVLQLPARPQATFEGKTDEAAAAPVHIR